MNLVPGVKTARIGYIYVMLAAFLWGSSGSAAKFLFNQGVTPFQLVQMRLTGAVCILFVWFVIYHRPIFKIRPKDILYFAILGGGAMAGLQFTYLLSLSKIHVAAAILLQYMAPALIAVHTLVIARERLSSLTILAIGLSLGGCYLVVGAYHLDILALNRVGIISGLFSALAFAWYSIQGEYGLRRYPPWTVIFYAFVFASLAWNIFYPPLHAFSRPYSLTEWGWIFFVVFFGTTLPFGFYLKGVDMIRSTRACITATLEPIIAGAMSFIFLNEIMDPLQITGGILVIASIILLQIKTETETARPDVLRARNIEG